MTFRATNPATGQLLYETAALSAAEGEALLARIAGEQQAWRRASIESRARFITALGAALRAHREALAEALALEMGKPIVAARSEVDKCAGLCDVAPAMAVTALVDEVVQDDEKVSVRVRHEALGNVLAIMPWNFPYWQALRFAVPALLAGNGVLIKPAPSVPGPARLLDQCLADARDAIASTDTPVAPCHIALFDIDSLDAVIGDARISGVTLTGSDRAGRHVAQVAGLHLKKVVLELGGSDPFVVLPTADVNRAATIAVLARTVNSGQSCVAAKRFIVCDAIYDEFLEKFSAGMRALVVGDPRDERTQVGPIATESVRDGLAAQVRNSVAQGARAVVGGTPDGQVGFFYPPTVLVDIPAQAPAACEELFGPVASVFRVRDADDALALANDSPYGLGASVWTRDADEAERFAAALDVGMVFVNDMVVSDARYPFGGVKQSGVGRELGLVGFREFTNVKTVRTQR